MAGTDQCHIDQFVTCGQTGVDRAELGKQPLVGLGMPHDQPTAIVQGFTEAGNQRFHCRLAEIDDDIAADNDVEPGDIVGQGREWALDQIVILEIDVTLEFGADLPLVEAPLEARRAQGHGHGPECPFVIAALPRTGQKFLIDIGAQDGHVPAGDTFAELPFQHDGD